MATKMCAAGAYAIDFGGAVPIAVESAMDGLVAAGPRAKGSKASRFLKCSF